MNFLDEIQMTASMKRRIGNHITLLVQANCRRQKEQKLPFQEKVRLRSRNGTKRMTIRRFREGIRFSVDVFEKNEGDPLRSQKKTKGAGQSPLAHTRPNVPLLYPNFPRSSVKFFEMASPTIPQVGD